MNNNNNNMKIVRPNVTKKYPIPPASLPSSTIKQIQSNRINRIQSNRINRMIDKSISSSSSSKSILELEEQQKQNHIDNDEEEVDMNNDIIILSKDHYQHDVISKLSKVNKIKSKTNMNTNYIKDEKKDSRININNENENLYWSSYIPLLKQRKE